MDMEHLRAFLFLAERGNFSEAARDMGISQPSLSKKIRRLEDVLGAALFLRTTHQTSLSAFGRNFLDDARSLLDHSSRVMDRGQKLARGRAGTIRVGFTFSAMEWLSAVLPQFAQKESRFDIIMEDMSSGEQETALKTGKIDVGFMRRSQEESLSFLSLTHEDLVLLVPYERTDITSLEDISRSDLPLVRFKKEFSQGIYDRTEQILQAHAVQPVYTLWFNESLSAIQVVRSGLACAMIHRSSLSILPETEKKFVIHPIRHPAARWEVGMATCDAGNNPARDVFRKEFSAYLMRQ
ncbi:LysR family transcriptional regulator [Acetobacter lambici]|uniref:LysR family transcriptional regulator n=1 Tax=Acetobacter lambici TaxID=1332824 RepID=A0ABT1F271_9PROT|nr:LysR family transcriptional regulator [Acetobacter lambici]MCP1243325.1 LysR family transcriptional regulator [Acetobacter lambici]MCP1259300.1 LysR family transcriptional regulator [Acetobacter lambici]NHO57515.1 LysR family transcriptional regulator [Acetobacter lambici]